MAVNRDPQTIGRYRVLEVLGSGGMGIVYLAEDPLLKRRVAIKLVRGGGLEQEEALARFRREAEVSARLNHPNVITVYDVGEEPGFGPFLTMEYVDGSNLAELSRSGALGLEAKLRVLIQSRRALEAAHAAGIVHRDVKPANLMLGKDGRVRLMDFGIARTEHTRGMTVSGTVLGTPSYISPEQLEGADPSPATDRYAFMVMAFELLAGRPPYSGASVSAILYKIAHEPPEFPERFDPRLRTVFSKALAKDPSQRFTTLDSFLRALIGAVELDLPVRARLLAMLDEGSAPPRLPPGEEELAADTPGHDRPGSSKTEPRLSRQNLAFFGAGGLVLLAMAVLGTYRAFLYHEEVAPASPPGPPPRLQPGRSDRIGPQSQADRDQPPPSATPALGEALENLPEAAPPQTDPDRLAAAARLVLAQRGLSTLEVEVTPDRVAHVRGETLSTMVPTIQAELGSIVGIERVDVSALVLVPTVAEAVPRLRQALATAGLGHAEVSVDTQGRLVVAGLASRAEETRAREVATRIAGKDVTLVTGIREPMGSPQRRVGPSARPKSTSPTPPREETPAWGEIHHEGAVRAE